MMRRISSTLAVVCATVAVLATFNARSYSAEVEIDRRIVEVMRDQVNNIVHYRDKLLHEPHRPAYHFVIPEGVSESFDPI